MNDEAITVYHRARDAGIRFALGADGRWVAHCSPALWRKWRPAIDPLWPRIVASLRPPLAKDRRASEPERSQSPQAWQTAAAAVARARKAAAPISGDGKASPPPQAAKPAKP